MGKYARKYEVEITVRDYAEQVKVDEALQLLAEAGIWVHSNRETDTRTGRRLTPLPLTLSYLRSRKGA